MYPPSQGFWGSHSLSHNPDAEELLDLVSVLRDLPVPHVATERTAVGHEHGEEHDVEGKEAEWDCHKPGIQQNSGYNTIGFYYLSDRGL